jgi:hypothetical protein
LLRLFLSRQALHISPQVAALCADITSIDMNRNASEFFTHVFFKQQYWFFNSAIANNQRHSRVVGIGIASTVAGEL